MTDRIYTPVEDTPALDALTSTRAAMPALLALALGVFILFGAGFAGAGVLHDAAHDSRHATAFPCH